MSDTAQNLNSNVNDIWSLPDPQQPVQALQINTSPQKPSGGVFGKPGLAGGEGGGFIESIQDEERPQNDEVIRDDEKLRNDEVVKSAEAHKPKDEKIKEPKVAQPEETPTKGKIVDQRTGKVITHRVAEIADKTTKIADIKEQEFIDGVWREHVESII